MDKLIYEAKAEILEEASGLPEGHPYLTFAKFVFTDDQPNMNKQGVLYEDFPALAKSAIDMPVKLRFLGTVIGGHKASIPIGHIKEIEEVTLENNVHQLVAKAALYSLEYPQEIAYLKRAHDAGKAPVISWELGYESDLLKDGTTWKTKPVAQAATFVRTGAYGTRTSLLALASLDVSEAELDKELTALASHIGTFDGGKTVDEKKEQEYLDKIKELEAQLTQSVAKVTETTTALSSAQAELETKVEVIKEYEKIALAETRVGLLVEAGIKIDTDPAKLKAKQEFLASLTEEVFTQYAEDLKAVTAVQKKTAFASLQPKVIVPRVSTEPKQQTNVSDLALRFRGLSRGTLVTE